MSSSHAQGFWSRWLGPTIASSGMIVPIPVGLLLAGHVSTTMAVVVSLGVGAALIATGFRIIGTQERAEDAARETGDRPAATTDPPDELERRLAELRRRNQTD